MSATASLESQIIAEVGECTDDPLKFAQRFFPWGAGELATSTGPRKWQIEILSHIRDHLQNPQTRHQLCQVAVASGKGIGKSALIAMIINWAMSTCGDCKVVVTANTGTQLATKTVPEVAKWTRLAFNRHWWEAKATSITSRQPGHEREWRTDFTPWSAENQEAFSGLHNEDKRMVVIFDEASGIDDIIWSNTLSTFTDKNAEMLWIAFGNPTQASGGFRECFGKNAHRWKTYRIDSRTVQGTNHEFLARQVEDHGEDSWFVRIWIRGEFPLVGTDQFIQPDHVEAARHNSAMGYERLPKILSCDVARYGADQTVIGWRQGRKAAILEKLRGKDTVFVAERVIHWQKEIKADATVVDGDGLGSGTVDHIKTRGFKCYEFRGGMTANDDKKYRNRRSEIWGLMRDWLAAGPEIPNDPELCDQLTAPLYSYNAKGQIEVETKDDMKERVPSLGSPDCADQLAMTFSVTVAPPPPPEPVRMYTPGEQSTGWMS
jgi:hypothetical protein